MNIFMNTPTNTYSPANVTVLKTNFDRYLLNKYFNIAMRQLKRSRLCRQFHKNSLKASHDLGSLFPDREREIICLTNFHCYACCLARFC